MLLSCEREEFSDMQTQEVVLEEASVGNKTFETVTDDEVRDFLTSTMSTQRRANPFVTYDLDSISHIDIQNSDALLTTIPARTKYEDGWSRIMLLKMNDSIHSVVYTMFSNNDFKTDVFSGDVLITDLEGNFINGLQIDEGILTNLYAHTGGKSNAVNTNTTNRSTDCECPYSCNLCGELDTVFIEDTPQIKIEYIVYTSVVPEDGVGEDPFIDAGDSTGGGGGNSGDGDSDDEEEEDKIDSDELTGEEKCLNDLLDKKGDSFVEGLLSKFKGVSDFDIKIMSKDKIWSEKSQKYVAGQTASPINNEIQIFISKRSAEGRSALSVTRTILHEYIHADIYRKLKTDYPTLGELDFRVTYKKYKSEHHETMAYLYISAMAATLKDFHKNVLIDDYNKYLNNMGEAPSDIFYEALAWQGLKNHDIQAYKDLSDDKKNAIANEEQKLGYLTKGCPN